MAEIIQNEPVQAQLIAFANKYNTTPEAILRLNNITDTAQIKSLDVLEMPKEEGITVGDETLRMAVETSTAVSPLMGDPVEPPEVSPLDMDVDQAEIDALLEQLDTPKETGAAPLTDEVAGGTKSGNFNVLPPSENLAGDPDYKPEGYTIDGETLSIDGETTTALGAVPPVTETTSDEGTTTTTPTISELDFESKPAQEITPSAPAKPAIPEAKAAEVDATADVAPAPGSESAVGQIQAPLKISEAVTASITNPEDKDFLREELKEYDELEVPKLDQAEYDRIGKKYDADIKEYDKKLEAISTEEMEPRFKGWDKFLAVLGAALGAYGSAMTGTPNFALNIINAEIDRDQQAFLNSQEARSRALNLQRTDLITRRGELLKLMVNKFNAAMQTYQGEIQKTQAEATLKKLQEEIQTNKEQFRIEIAAQVQSEIVASQRHAATLTSNEKIAAGKITQSAAIAAKKEAKADAIREADLSREDKKMWVPPIDFKDGEGNQISIPGYKAVTEKEAAEFRKNRALGKKVNNIMDDMESLLQDASRWSPAIFSKTSARLEQLSNELILIVKMKNNMGANFTVPEQIMIKSTVPTATIKDKIGVALIKLAGVREQYIKDEYAVMESQGWRRPQAAVPAAKPPTGLQKGFAKK